MSENKLIKELTSLAIELTAYLQPSKDFEKLLLQSHGDDYPKFKLDKLIQINNSIDVVNAQLIKSTKD